MPVRLYVGDCVLVKTSIDDDIDNTIKQGVGLIKYIGFIHGSQSPLIQYVGIELLESIPNGHNGTIAGYQYFVTPKGHGIHVKLTNIIQKLSISDIMRKLKDVITFFKSRVAQYVEALNERDEYIEILKNKHKNLKSSISFNNLKLRNTQNITDSNSSNHTSFTIDTYKNPMSPASIMSIPDTMISNKSFKNFDSCNSVKSNDTVSTNNTHTSSSRTTTTYTNNTTNSNRRTLPIISDVEPETNNNNNNEYVDVEEDEQCSGDESTYSSSEPSGPSEPSYSNQLNMNQALPPINQYQQQQQQQQYVDYGDYPYTSFYNASSATIIALNDSNSNNVQSLTPPKISTNTHQNMTQSLPQISGLPFSRTKSAGNLTPNSYAPHIIDSQQQRPTTARYNYQTNKINQYFPPQQQPYYAHKQQQFEYSAPMRSMKPHFVQSVQHQSIMSPPVPTLVPSISAPHTTYQPILGYNSSFKSNNNMNNMNGKRVTFSNNTKRKKKSKSKSKSKKRSSKSSVYSAKSSSNSHSQKKSNSFADFKKDNKESIHSQTDSMSTAWTESTYYTDADTLKSAGFVMMAQYQYDDDSL